MEDLIGGCLAVVAGIAVVGFVLWIVVAFLARVFSYLLVIWGIAFLLALMIGVVVGVIMPIRVLLAKSGGRVLQVTPDLLTEGKVIRHKPRSPNAEHGWDSAWPNYLPYQARHDASGVSTQARTHLAALWNRFMPATGTKREESSSTKAGGIGRMFGSLAGAVPKLLRSALVLPPFAGYLVGVWASTLSWLVVMSVLGLVVTAVQGLMLGGYMLFDVGDRRRLRASVKCTHCYGTSTLPGYRCANPDCDVVHWTMLPGPLGLFTRRCSCGTQLPNTVSSAAKRLTPVCPYCQMDLAGGSGGRQTIQIGLIGSIGAGKSLLLDASMTELARVLDEIGGTFAPLNEDANTFFQHARARREQHALTQKTPHRSPVGLPFLVQKGKISAELQVLDVAGEAFANWDEASSLRYLDTAEGIVLTLDPLALPEIRDHLRRSPHAHSVLLATGDQEAAYGTAVDRLRADSVALKKRGLAVVLTKGDVLMKLPVAASLDTADSTAIQQWLVEHGADLMVRRFEKDFRDVRYFLADSMGDQDLRSATNPWWVLNWLLTEAKSPLKLDQSLTAPVGATSDTDAEPEIAKEASR